MSWDQNLTINPYQSGKVNGNYGGYGNPFAGGTRSTQGASAVDKELAEVRSFLNPQNSDHELRPNNDESGSFFKNTYF